MAAASSRGPPDVRIKERMGRIASMAHRDSGRAAWESAVVVRVPALDQMIDELRRRFHLALKPNGIRPHITSLIPFLPAAELAEERELPALRALCAGLRPFDVSFSRTDRFPRVLYLAP